VKLANFRDVGGVTTADGRMFRAGVLFRSAELSRLSPSDQAKLRDFNFKLICDLRSPKESNKHPLRVGGIRVTNISLHDPVVYDGNRRRIIGFLFGRSGGDRFRAFVREYYHHLAFERSAPIREAMTLLARENSLPALIHCQAGKDRTGWLAALIQLLVGVPYETVRDDYLLTNDYYESRFDRFIRVLRIMTLFQVPAERIRLILTTHPESLDEVHGRIVEEYGSVAEYLAEACGIERDILSRLKGQLLTS